MVYPFQSGQVPESHKNQIFLYFSIPVYNGQAKFTYYASEGIRVNSLTNPSKDTNILPGNIVDLYSGESKTNGYFYYHRLGSFTVADRTSTVVL